MTVAKDQNGCRFLQRKFDEGGPIAISKVLPEVLANLIELMMDPFGNYLIQKLLDRCSEDQRLQAWRRQAATRLLKRKGRLTNFNSKLLWGPTQVLLKAAEKKELVNVALNTHGTRAVQKLIETLTTREQVC